MLKRLNDLSFVIGLFFSIVALILLGDSFLNGEADGKLNVYTGTVFLIFGLLMMTIRRNKHGD